MNPGRKGRPGRRKGGVESLDGVFRPRSVAVVGASRRPEAIGHELVRSLVDGGFQGTVHPVNPGAGAVHSIRCHPSVEAIPGPVDLAVLVVPALAVLPAARDCVRKGVKGLVVISAGFAEIGAEGRKRQDDLLQLCRRSGIRLVGPNCMGVLNTDPSVSMNATFAATTPEPGSAAFLSQSGALGEAILADARSLGLGVSMFASIGNRADVSPTDLLEYWDRDERTEQILLYLEGFGNPEHFMAVARRVSRRKPVLVVKSGRTASGARAAVSHTGSLAGSEAAVDSLLAQCGVLRVDNMKDLFCLASAVQARRFPRGRRVGILTNAGGPAILATDACVHHGLRIASLAPATRRRLRAVIPPEASDRNPVDLIASADAGRFDQALTAMLGDRSVDMLLAIFVSPVMIDAAAVARVFARHARRSKKPLVACLLGKQQGEEAEVILRAASVPNYRFPEEAALSLAGLARLAELRDRPDDAPPRFRVRKQKGRAVLEQAQKDGREMLQGPELDGLLTAYGIPVVPGRLVSRSSDALEAAAELGWPVALKVIAAGLEHKSDSGGVVLDLRGAGELLRSWKQLDRRFQRVTGRRFLIQPMRTQGVEVFFGAATDPMLGRMLAFGLGGIHVEVLKDVVFRLHPLTPADAREMVTGIRAQAMLAGVRGRPGVDQEELVEVLLRLNRLLTDCPEIEELDLNPFLAGYRGRDSCTLDARLKLGRSSGRRDPAPPARRGRL